MSQPSPVTRILHRIAAGDAGAERELLPLVYGELHGLARGYMGGERAQHTLQPTALIHEAWLRMSGDEGQEWQDRGHFLAVAARAMRRVLIDHARKRGARKRDGGEREGLDGAVELFEEQGPDLLVLDESLSRLAAMDPQLGRIVEMRYFGGASNEEIAQALEVSTRTVERGWKTAQSWLRADLEESAPGPDEQ